MSSPHHGFDRYMHDVIIEKYFALTSGKAVFADITAFVPEHTPLVALSLNNALRRLPKMYPGLCWAPMAKHSNLGYFIRLAVTDIELFKWGWRSESSILKRGICWRSEHPALTWDISPLPSSVVTLSAVLESPRDDLTRQLPLPPRCDVKLSMILEMFLEAVDYDAGDDNMQWEGGPPSHRRGGFRVVEMVTRGMCQVLW